VKGGGSITVLREILGHSSVTVTERYAHLVRGTSDSGVSDGD
jgi:site-specific recombinase XerD